MNMHLSSSPNLKPLIFNSSSFLQNQSSFSIPICRFGYGGRLSCNFLNSTSIPFTPIYIGIRGRRKSGKSLVKAKSSESPYQVLGVSPSATPAEIKRAYTKLALKYHPDVNEEANAQEKFMRIKHAYNTVLNSDSRNKYDSGKRTSEAYNYKPSQDEDFYGFGGFFKDLQEEYRNWEASAPQQTKPKSLWEELSEIGEEFVEKELNMTDSEEEKEKRYEEAGKSSNMGSSIEENIDENEGALAELKRELGL